MCSLTPGTLQKLLENVGNKYYKVAGEHRSAILQVISIMPSLEDDPWKSRGYFLRISDSLHSAYVSVSDKDVDLILGDKIQLGQFIYVSGLDSGSPVPVLKGLKPIPKRHPCVGEPKDLISSDFINVKKVETKLITKRKVKKIVAEKEDKVDNTVRRLSLGNGKIGISDNRRLSLDSTRKVWDHKDLRSRDSIKVMKPKSEDRSMGFEFASGDKVFLLRSPKSSTLALSSAASPLKSKNDMLSPKNLPKPVVKNSKLSNDGNIFPSDFKKVSLCSNSKTSWSSLSPSISNLGKDVRCHKKVACASAAHALEEASLYEDVLQCLSMFAELEKSDKDSSGPLVEQFLNLHESITKAASNINALIDTKISGNEDCDDCTSQALESGNRAATSANKNASIWVRAAVTTDFSKFSILRKSSEKDTKSCEENYYVVIENNPSEKINTESPLSSKHKKNPSSHNLRSRITPKLKESSTNSKHCVIHNGKNTVAKRKPAWSQGSGLRHASTLAEKLLSYSRSWFLNYLENSLSNGFISLKHGDEISQTQMTAAIFLGQLRRVNQWLDDVALLQGDDHKVDVERIGILKKKLYGFLLDHVDSAVSQR